MSIWKYFNVYSANVGLKSELNILLQRKSEVYRADSVFLQGRKPVFWLGAWHLCSMQGNVPHAAQRNLVLRYSDGCHRCTPTLPARCGTFLSNETYNYQPESLLEMVTTQVAVRWRVFNTNLSNLSNFAERLPEGTIRFVLHESCEWFECNEDRGLDQHSCNSWWKKLTHSIA